MNTKQVTARQHRFLVVAEPMTDQRSQITFASGSRVSRVIEAWSELHAMRLARDELARLAYRVVSVEQLSA